MKIARITSDYVLKISGNIYNVWDAIENTDNIDDTYEIDDTTEINDTSECSSLFLNFLNIGSTDSPVDVIRLNDKGDFIIPEVYNVWDSFDGAEEINSTTYTIDSETSLDSSDEISVLLSLLFGVDVESSAIDKFRIYRNKLLCADVLENQMMT
jgi:hypothetical protein